jgi:hypothetical protein
MRKWTFSDLRIGIGVDFRDMALSVAIRVPRVQETLQEGYSTLFGMFHSNSGHKRLVFYYGYQKDSEPEKSIVLGTNLDSVRHDYRLRLAKEIDLRLQAFELQAEKCPHLYQAHMGYRPKTTSVMGALYEAGRRGYMPWSRVGNVDKEFFNIHRMKRTTGRLLEIYCEEAKRNRPVPNQMKQCDRFRQLLPTRQVQFMM